jgi:hypothetical protein
MARPNSLGNFFSKVRSIMATGVMASIGLAALAQSASAAAPDAPANLTTSQASSNQLNQLFAFETTNNKSAANEGYVTASFDYLKFPHKVFEYRYQVQGQYSFTNQLAVGAFVPLVHSRLDDTNTGFGDLVIYGQYKLDQLVPHYILDLTAQLDVVLPTGDRHEFRDTGRFGVRPMIQAYKDFGQFGPGHIGAYGEMGFTITEDSDFRFGFAGTYEWERIVGILEFYDQSGGKIGRPFVTFTPGLAYRPGPFEVALGFPIGLNKGSPNFGVVIKGTFAW